MNVLKYFGCFASLLTVWLVWLAVIAVASGVYVSLGLRMMLTFDWINSATTILMISSVFFSIAASAIGAWFLARTDWTKERGKH